MIRLVQLLRRPTGMSAEQFRTYWRDVHGPMVASMQTTLDILRHIQIHPDPAAQPLVEGFSALRGGLLPPYDGVAETWWRSEEALIETLESPEGQAAHARWVESERAFLDQSASPLWLAREYPQVSTIAGRPVAAMRSGVIHLHFALQVHAHMGDEAGHRYWLHQHGPLVRSHAPARGMIAYGQVHRDETPSAQALTARMAALHGSTSATFVGHADAWFDRQTGYGGPERNLAGEVAVDDERKFIDWDRSVVIFGKDHVFVDRDWA